MNLFNGWKTAIGAVGLILTTIAPKLAPVINEIGPEAINVGANVSALLASIGVIHKLIKSRKGGNPG